MVYELHNSLSNQILSMVRMLIAGGVDVNASYQRLYRTEPHQGIRADRTYRRSVHTRALEVAFWLFRRKESFIWFDDFLVNHGGEIAEELDSISCEFHWGSCESICPWSSTALIRNPGIALGQ